jgi:hypothetical protein
MSELVGVGYMGTTTPHRFFANDIELYPFHPTSQKQIEQARQLAEKILKKFCRAQLQAGPARHVLFEILQACNFEVLSKSFDAKGKKSIRRESIFVRLHPSMRSSIATIAPDAPIKLSRFSLQHGKQIILPYDPVVGAFYIPAQRGENLPLPLDAKILREIGHNGARLAKAIEDGNAPRERRVKRLRAIDQDSIDSAHADFIEVGICCTRHPRYQFQSALRKKSIPGSSRPSRNQRPRWAAPTSGSHIYG